MAHLYYTAETLSAGVLAVTLVGDEARHASAVSRLRVGEGVSVSDGHGRVADGVATEVSNTRVTLEVANIREPAILTPEFVLVQALAKGDRDEMAVQMCTELGAAAIVPWQAERSVSRWTDDKVVKGRARWSTIAREASKQAMRATIPEVHAPATTVQLAALASESVTIVLDPRADVSLDEWAETHRAVDRVHVVVGPEGGITPSELDALVNAGAQAVRVGHTVLRTSTAGAATFSALRALFGQL